MDVNELKQFEIFNKLNDEEVSLFKEKMREITVPEGENFIIEGDVGDSIYLLLKMGYLPLIKSTNPKVSFLRIIKYSI